MFQLSVLAWTWESVYSTLDLQLLIAGLLILIENGSFYSAYVVF